MEQHEQYMNRCLRLAQLGERYVGQNPLVGAVLVYNGQIIGEGYHQKYGEAHAEINCLNSVCTEYRKLISKSTLYVNLEPCNHTGKTPPCSHAIVEAGIKKVIVGTEDLNPQVAGSGIEYLHDNDVHVEVGFCKPMCLKLNRVFFTNQKEKRAFIKLKWSQTANGYLGEVGRQTRITNDYINTINHKHRTKTDGVLVGYNTGRIDTPNLTSRHWQGKQPSRIFLDWNCELDDAIINHDKRRTIVLNSLRDSHSRKVEFHKVEKTPKAIAQKLYELNISSVLIEGGAKTHEFFIQEELWDEAVIIQSRSIISGNGVHVAQMNKGRLLNTKTISNYQVSHYSNSEFLR